MFLIQVTSVGINTEWGMLMSSISEDNGEETPLQVSVSIIIVIAFLTIYVFFTFDLFSYRYA